MKKTRKLAKVTAYILLLSLCLGLVACGREETPVAEATAPVADEPAESVEPASGNNTVGSYAQLLAAQPAVVLNDVPAGAENVSYYWLNNIPVISVITFTYKGVNYEYHGAPCPGGTASSDISGVTAELKTVASVSVKDENTAGGSYVIRYNSETGEGVCNWVSDFSSCQYSLYTDKGCLGSVDAMPVAEVMKSLYISSTDRKTETSAIAQSLSGKSLTVTLANNTTAAIDCSYIENLQVESGDIIDIEYSGDLAGNAVCLKMTKTGKVSTLSVNGTVFGIYDSYFYLLTVDSNVYSIGINKSTSVTGVDNTLQYGQEIKVTYDGDLNGEATATEIVVEKKAVVVTPEPTETPKTTASPKPTSSIYTDRTAVGLVTSCAGYFTTVCGITFTINPSECYVSGKMVTGAYATVNYRDYGNNFYKVTSAYFVTTPSTPTPVPYTEHSCAGYVTYVNGYYVGVEGGYEFFVNPANIPVSGYAQVGGYAMIYYRDYGYGYYEVTSASFSAAEKETYELGSTYGYVDTYTGPGGYISVAGIGMNVSTTCSTTGFFGDKTYATVWYAHYSDGRYVANQIEFYQ